jgi:hypothetical protein
MAERNEEKVKLELQLELQGRIASRLDDLGYTDAESRGDILHHLPEVAVLGNNLFKDSIPKFLALPVGSASDLADIIVSIQWDLEEMKDAIAEMEPHLLKLVNFLNP